MGVVSGYVIIAFCDSRRRCCLTPDKMATSNGGGMEVDGAGKYLSLIPSFKSYFSTDEFKDLTRVLYILGMISRK